MISLDDPRWPALDHRGWSEGKGAEDAPFVPDELRYLVDHPESGGRFNDLWPYLCSEGTAWPAAYASVPHLVTIARALPAADRDDYLYVIGLVAMCSGDLGEVPDDLPDDIADAYRRALPEALTLLAETLVTGEHDQIATRYLLAATAALKGHPEYAEILNDLDVYAECQSCGEPMLELPE
ncbi:hypothetical protein ACFYXF_26620 [Streptomyces sp. NPDC002680]|uniref:hypothetical protein n=1 Tax=Streptomyces sp. NPDC002680 TaxID=3364659 RepID=UPI0036CE13D1